MKIIDINLSNFQGIPSLGFKFDGRSAAIYGDNATGKTTVFNALTWLLFGGASTGAKNYTPKTRGPQGDLHYLDHEAQARFIMDDGRLVTLRKVFHENYKKRRGSATEEFDGHSVDFFIDGVPVKEKEYTAALLGFCGGAEKMKMLTMPHYFAEGMPWDARRKILLEVCGDVSDDDVIASDASLAELNSYLLMPGTTGQFYSVEEYKKIAAAQKAEINKQLQSIPNRIDEAQRAIPEEAIDVAAIDAKLTDLQSLQERLTDQKAAILAGDAAVSDARKRTAQAQTALTEARIAYTEQAAQANQSTYDAISALQVRIVDAEGRKTASELEEVRARKNAERVTLRREELLREYANVQAETWDERQAICPTCHRELPIEDVTRMREEFNLHKSERLQAINKKGRGEASKEIIADLQRLADRNQAEVERAKEELAELSRQRANLTAQLQTVSPFEQTEGYARLSAAVAACQAAEKEARGHTAEAVESVDTQLNAVYEQVRQLQQLRGQASQAEAQRRRVAELEAQEKDLSARYEELEKGIYLCDLFTKAKVRMLTDRINGKFESVRFRLFVEQVNGGVRDDCEVLVPNEETGALVPYRDANNAGRIKAGLEIINVLSAHWGLSMPVFIDNAEGVQNVAHPNTQLIQLIVPVSWDKLGAVVRSALISVYGSEEQARRQYEAPNKKLRLELDGKREETSAA